MAYRITLAPRAERSVRRLPGDLQRRVADRITGPSEDPRPSGAIQMKNQAGVFRIRVGAYRVVYAIDDLEQTVLVEAIGPRKDIYRPF